MPPALAGGPIRRALEPLVHPGGGRGIARAAWRVASLGLAVCGLALIAFHVWLFWGQWQAGVLTEPLRIARWAASALVAAALIVVHRRGAGLFRGRRAVVLWTLVAMIHVGAGTPAVFGTPTDLPDAVVYVVPTIVGGALLVGFGLLAAARRRTLPYRPAVALSVAMAPTWCHRSPHRRRPFSLRAPPLRLA